MRGKGAAGGVAVEWAAITDVGRARAVNEDAVFAGSSVFVVADGMGGHQAGDVASAMVAERFAALAGERLCAMEDVVETIDTVNREILEQGRSEDTQQGMGTTAVGLLLVDNGTTPSFLVFNVGDSRAYCLSEAGLEQLSVDHSYVQELVDAGELSSRDARAHPRRNVVTRALGVDESPRVDYWLRPPVVGERYLLCSDGLNSELDDDTIATVLTASTLTAEAAEDLVRLALDAGGRDNVSVLVLDVLGVQHDIDELTDTAPRGLIAAVDVGVSPDSTAEQVKVDVAEAPELVSEVPVEQLADGADPSSDRAPMRLGALIETVPEAGSTATGRPIESEHADG